MQDREKAHKDVMAEPIPDSDGAVRELEKADRAAHASPQGQEKTANAKTGKEVISLGKYGSGATEDAVADSNEKGRQE